MKCHCCASEGVRATFPFKRKLSCAAFRCDSLRLSGGRVSSGSAMRMDIGMGGAKSHTNGAIIRLCMRTPRARIIHPIERLEKFRGVFLRTNRRGAIAFALSRETFTC